MSYKIFLYPALALLAAGVLMAGTASAGGIPVPIIVPSFEIPANGDDGYFGWYGDEYNDWKSYEGGHTYIGCYNVLEAQFDGADGNNTPEGADGKQVLYFGMMPPAFYDAPTGYHNCVYQVLEDTLQEGTYTMTVAVGDAKTTPVPAIGWEFSLSTDVLGGMYHAAEGEDPAGWGTPLAMTSGGFYELAAKGKFYDQELTFVVAADNPHIGEAIRIDIGTSAAGFDDHGYLDNVRLDYRTIPGDANGDWEVNETDAAAMSANWLKMGDATWVEGDFNDDGNVDDLDAVLLATNWTGTGAVAQVPEPSTLMLLACGLIGLAIAKFRKA